MKNFSRKNNTFIQLLNWMVFLSGFYLIYIGLFRLFWLWNIVTFPGGLLISIIGYLLIYRSRRVIKSLEFKERQITIELMNGKKRVVSKDNLEYSLLIKYYANPVRAIKLKDKTKRIKTIGVLKASGWNSTTKDIASYLMKENYLRRQWGFGFSAGEIILSVALLIGVLEVTPEGMLEEAFRNAGDTSLADIVVESTEIADEIEKEEIKNSRKAEKEYLKDKNESSL